MEAPSRDYASNEIRLSVSDTPGYTHVEDLTDSSTKKASKLLTVNHNEHHMRWAQVFHNHVTHHLLTLWSLGASPQEIQDMYDYNKFYQIPLKPQNPQKAEDLDLSDPDVFNDCLGKDEYYADFLRIFEKEVDLKGVESVVKEYLFQGNERANDIFCRMFTDLVHPLIHLGCAIEYKQPSLVAEALASACAHNDWTKEFLLATENFVESNVEITTRPLLQTLESMRNDAHIKSGVKNTDPFNKIQDGFLKRVTVEQLLPYLSQFQVAPNPEDLQQKMSEIMQTFAYVLGAAQQPDRRVAMDFVLLHGVTLSVFYPAFLALDWLSDQEKSRLLEAGARMDMVLYAGCGSPELFPQRILDYKPEKPQDGWPELIHRSVVYRDEGHMAKLTRALYSIQQLEGASVDLPIAKSDFIKIAHMALDSAENAIKPGGNNMPDRVAETMEKSIGIGGEMVNDNMKRYVFYGGIDGSWKFVPSTEIVVNEAP